MGFVHSLKYRIPLVIGYGLPIWRILKGLGTVLLSVSMLDQDESVEKVSVARKY